MMRLIPLKNNAVKTHAPHTLAGRFLAFLLMLCFLSDLSLPSAMAVSATDSSYLSFFESGHRAYMEYGEHTYAGMERKQLIYAYIKEGETVYFGSDIYDSELNINHEPTGEITGCDIVVIDPKGSAASYDVVQNGIGHIINAQMEVAGPNVDGSNPEGYSPFSFTAVQTGVYTFHFHSKNAQGVKNNPTPAEAGAAWENSNATVASRDISVYDGSRLKSGRSYTKTVAWNLGSNGLSLDCILYVVTNDGYIYKTDFNGMDPFGFMFFACNRGLIDTATNMPAYHSFLSKNNELSDIGEYNLGFHSPYLPDTQQDVTYMIFDEEPDPELCGILYPTAFEPLQATNFEFIGVYGDNNTLVNCGGYFKFDIANATSVTVTIDLSHVKFTVDGAEEYRDLGIVRLNNTATAGTNYLYWDGCDGNGNPLPAGTYDKSSVRVSIETHSGEYHFPLLDVENNPNGIIVTRINKIFREEVNPETGELLNVDITEKYKGSQSLIYYNNADVPGSFGKGVADGADYSVTGVDSSTGAMKFISRGGDQAAIDIWTYASGEKISVPLEEEIVIKDFPVSSIVGKIFYDANHDGSFSAGTSDCALQSVEVSVNYTYEHFFYDSSGAPQSEKITVNDSTYTDASGVYRFFGIPSGLDPEDCTITISKPVDFYSITTETITTSELPDGQITQGTEVQSFKLGGADANGEVIHQPRLTMSDVGYYYVSENTALTIVKDWKIDKSFDSNRPQSITAVVTGGYYSDDEKTIWNEKYRTEVRLDEFGGWSKTLTNLPSSFLVDPMSTDSVQPLEYRVTDEIFTTRDGTVWRFSRDSGSDAYPYQSAIQNQATPQGFLSVITNAPKTTTFQLVKRDNDTGSLLSGAFFQLYIENPETFERVPVASGTTNSAGVLLFDNLIQGNYYVVEITPPENYQLNQTEYHFRIEGKEMENHQQTVYNTAMKTTLTLNKNVDIAMYGQGFIFTVTYADNSDFSDAQTIQKTLMLQSGVTEYSVFEELSIPLGSWVKIEESHSSYNQNIYLSTLTYSTVYSLSQQTLISEYACGTPFRVNKTGNYTLTLQNDAEFLDTLHFQKVWINSDGSLLDFNANTPTAATLGLSEVVCELQVSSDGGAVWETVTKKYPASNDYMPKALAPGECNITAPPSAAFGNGETPNQTLSWMKRLGQNFWNLPVRDIYGNELLYRIVENEDRLPDGYARYSGAINYDDRGATFKNPVTGKEERLDFYTDGENTLSKNKHQQNMYIINYASAEQDYSLCVRKTDGDTGAPLAGAEFTLYREATESELNDTSVSKTIITYGGEDFLCISLGSAVSTPDQDGNASAEFYDKLNIGGVYYLAETRAPTGYRPLSSAIKVLITDSGGGISATVDGFPAALAGKKIEIELANFLSLQIPVSGTTITGRGITVIGLLIITAAASSLTFLNCKRKNK